MPKGRAIRGALEGLWHGSPNKFDKFDSSKIGTGHGAQAHGRGLYLSESLDEAKGFAPRNPKYEAKLLSLYNRAQAAEDYASAEVYEQAMLHDLPFELEQRFTGPEYQEALREVSKISPPGTHGIYKANINASLEEFLDLDKPLKGQPAWEDIKRRWDERLGDPDIIMERLGIDENTSTGRSYIQSIPDQRDDSIPGVTYTDSGKGETRRNYVVFNDKLIDITRKFGLPGAIGAGVLAGDDDQPPGFAGGGKVVRGALDQLPPFFSTLEELVRSSKQPAMPLEQWQSYLRPGREVKRDELSFPLRKDELEHTYPFADNFSSYMQETGKTPKDRVTAEELLEALSRRQLPEFKTLSDKTPPFGSTLRRVPDDVIYEATDQLKAMDEAGIGPGDKSSVIAYNLRDALAGDVHRQNVIRGNLTGAEQLGWFEDLMKRTAHLRDDVADGALPPKYDDPNYIMPGDRSAYTEELTNWPGMQFEGGHFDPDTLSHSRATRRTGPGGGVRFIEEIQSDPHQKARSEGYKTPLDQSLQEQAIAITRKYFPESRDPNAIARPDNLKKYGGTPEEVRVVGQALKNWKQDRYGVPRSPFSESYLELELKKNLARAVEDGDEYLAWTTPEVQIKRYGSEDGGDNGLDDDFFTGMEESYGKKLPSVAAKLAEKFGGKIVETNVPIKLKQIDQQKIARVLSKNGIEHGDLGQIAEKMQDLDGIDGPNEDAIYELLGEPENFDEVAEALGFLWEKAPVVTIQTRVPAIRITPEMRERVKRIGLPLFSVPPVVALGEDQDDQPPGFADGGYTHEPFEQPPLYTQIRDQTRRQRERQYSEPTPQVRAGALNLTPYLGPHLAKSVNELGSVLEDTIGVQTPEDFAYAAAFAPFAGFGTGKAVKAAIQPLITDQTWPALKRMGAKAAGALGLTVAEPEDAYGAPMPKKGFFSALEQLISGSKQKAMPVEQWQSYLRPGREAIVQGERFPLRADELEWSGLPEKWKELSPGTRLTADELLELLDERPLPVMKRLDEGKAGKVKVGDRELDGIPTPTTVYDDPRYNLPGPRTDYVEDLTKFQDERGLRAKIKKTGLRLPEDIEGGLRVLRETTKLKEQNNFKSTHFGRDGQNLLSHSRASRRKTVDGASVRLIEEAQSDQHQKGRDEGYRGPPLTPKEKKRYDELSEEYSKYRAARFGLLSDPEVAEHRELENRLRGSERGIPRAPFSETYGELEFKKQLLDAVNDGDEYLAWTPGNVQAKRYDQMLTENVSGIKYHKEPNGKYSIDAIGPDGDPLIFRGDTRDLDENGLRDLVGADIAKKIINDEGTSSYRVRNASTRNIGKSFATEEEAKEFQNGLPIIVRAGMEIVKDKSGTITGDNLTVGGGGMRKFYDEEIKSVADKLAKKFGGEVTKVKVPGAKPIANEPGEIYNALGQFSDSRKAYIAAYNKDLPALRKALESEGRGVTNEEIERIVNRVKELTPQIPEQEVWALRITPEMRAKIQKTGLPLFTGAGIQLGDGSAVTLNPDGTYEDDEPATPPAFAGGGHVLSFKDGGRVVLNSDGSYEDHR